MLDQLTRALSAAAPRGEFSVIPLYNPRRGADARVFIRDLRPVRLGSEPTEAGEPAAARELTAGGEPAAGELTTAGELAAAHEALAALPEVDAVRAHGGALTVCFADEPLARLGERLEAGETGALDTHDLLGGAAVLVNFCDANPTKALHVGHLRNIALGQALAGVLAAAGARVTRQSQVSDYCRSMGEALAGYGELPAHLTPRATGVKSDHFVGDCYLRYAGTPDASREGGDRRRGPCAERRRSRSRRPRRGAAQAPERRRPGDRGAVAQAARLGTGGARRDARRARRDARPGGARVGLPAAHAVDPRHRAGERRAHAHRQRGGRVRDGRGRVPAAAAGAADGFPTQHLRTFALWQALRASLDGTRSVELVGEEWHAYVRYHERLMQGIAPSQAPPQPSDNVIYGMVTVAGGAVKSSTGRPPLVDELLERLSASPELGALAAQSEGRFEPRDLAALVAVGFYLGRPTRKPVDLTVSEMLDLRGGVGWDLARAAVRAWNPRYDGPPDPAPEDGRYRQTVLRSQAHRQLVERAVEQLDTYELARFYGHLSRRYVAAEAGRHAPSALADLGMRAKRVSPPIGPVSASESARTANGARAGDGEARVARAMRTLLAAGLDALGLPGAAL